MRRWSSPGPDFADDDALSSWIGLEYIRRNFGRSCNAQAALAGLDIVHADGAIPDFLKNIDANRILPSIVFFLVLHVRDFGAEVGIIKIFNLPLEIGVHSGAEFRRPPRLRLTTSAARSVRS